VFPHVEAIVSDCHVPEVILVSVTEAIEIPDLSAASPIQGVAWVGSALNNPPQNIPLSGPKSPRMLGRMYTQADKYLDRIQERLAKKGIQSRTEVMMGEVAAAIVTFAEKNEVDLIVMDSHGRSGLSRWAHGSVAEKVFRASCIPILMVRP
jgi:nucleotide-binding universal stress UspA family protein